MKKKRKTQFLSNQAWTQMQFGQDLLLTQVTFTYLFYRLQSEIFVKKEMNHISIPLPKSL